MEDSFVCTRCLIRRNFRLAVYATKQGVECKVCVDKLMLRASKQRKPV